MFLPHVQSSVIYKSQDMETIHAHQWVNGGGIFYVYIYKYVYMCIYNMYINIYIHTYIIFSFNTHVFMELSFCNPLPVLQNYQF